MSNINGSLKILCCRDRIFDFSRKNENLNQTETTSFWLYKWRKTLRKRWNNKVQEILLIWNSNTENWKKIKITFCKFCWVKSIKNKNNLINKNSNYLIILRYNFIIFPIYGLDPICAFFSHKNRLEIRNQIKRCWINIFHQLETHMIESTF